MVFVVYLFRNIHGFSLPKIELLSFSTEIQLMNLVKSSEIFQNLLPENRLGQIMITFEWIAPTFFHL